MLTQFSSQSTSTGSEISDALKNVPGSSGSSAVKTPPDSYAVLTSEVVDMSALASALDSMPDADIKSGAADDLDELVLRTFSSGPSGGIYRACVVNDVTQWTSKVVSLSLRTGERGQDGHVPHPGDYADEPVPDPRAAAPEHVKPIASMLEQISKKLTAVEDKQRTARHRLDLHSALNLQSHSRMVVGSLFETAVFVLVSIGQLWLLKRWFMGRGLPV